MKKISVLLIFAALLCLSDIAYAQNLITSDYLGVIPGLLCKNGNPIAVSSEAGYWSSTYSAPCLEEGKTTTVYNENLQVDRYIIPSTPLKNPKLLKYRDYDNCICPVDDFYLSQTLFNQDELFEMVTTDDNGTYIQNENGTVLWSTTVNAGNISVYKYNDNTYLEISQYSLDGKRYVYKIENSNNTKSSKADVNSDGVVDIADVNAVVGVICGKYTDE